MRVIEKARNYYKTTAQAAHLYSITRYGFSPNGYKPNLSGTKQAANFCLGLYLLAKEAVNTKSDSPQFNQPALQAAVLIDDNIASREIRVNQTGVHKPFVPNFAAAVSKGNESSDPEAQRLNLIDFSRRFFEMIKINAWAKQGWFNSANLDQWFRNAIDPNTENPSLGEVINHLIAQYKIERVEDTKYRVVNQERSMMGVAENLEGRIEGASTLRSIFMIAEDCFGKLWENSTHYIYDQQTGELRLAGRRKGRSEDSPYREWKVPQYLYKRAIEDYIRTGRVVLEFDLAEELRKQTAGGTDLVDPSSIKNDYNLFSLDRGNPGKILVGVYSFTDQETLEKYAGNPEEIRKRSIRGVWSASNRILKEEENRLKDNWGLRYKPPISPNHGIRDVAGPLRSLILRPIAKGIAKLTRAMAAKAAWDREEEDMGIVPVLDPEWKAVAISYVPNGSTVAISPEKVKYDPSRYLPEGKPIKIKRKNALGQKISLKLELIKEPYRFLSERSDEIVEDLFRVFTEAWKPVIGRELDNTEFYKKYIFEKYFKKAEKLAVLRDENNKIVGFASMTREQVGKHQVFCLAGTVLLPAYQEMRLSVKLNQVLTVEAWGENKHKSGGEIYVAARTANPRVVGAMSALKGYYPDPYHAGKEPTQEQREICQTLSRRWTPNVEFDGDKFISRAALTEGVGGLLYDKDLMQLYHDRLVNEYCLERLDYKKGDLFLVIGKFSRRVLIKTFFKSIYRSLQSMGRGLFSRLRRSLFSLTLS